MPMISQTTFDELPPFLRDRYRPMVERADAWSQQPYAAYQDERIAAIPEEIARGHGVLRDNLAAEMPLFDYASSRAKEAFSPFYAMNRATGRTNAEEYMNPYTQAVVRQIAEEGNRNFTENVLPALEAKFVRLGQHGSGKHQELGMRAARDLQHEILNRQQQALSSGYQQAGQMYNAQQARNIEGAAQLGNLAASRQGSRFADIAGLESAGRYRQQQNQAALDTRYQNWLREQEHPMYRNQQLSAFMAGVPSQGINQSYYQTPATPALNIPGQFGQIAGNILAARMALGAR
jgi:hypothetical protein